MCWLVSGTSPVSGEVEPPWIGLVPSAHPTDAQLNWGVCAPCQHLKRVPQTITEPFLLCCKAKREEKGVYGLK